MSPDVDGPSCLCWMPGWVSMVHCGGQRAAAGACLCVLRHEQSPSCMPPSKLHLTNVHMPVRRRADHAFSASYQTGRRSRVERGRRRRAMTVSPPPREDRLSTARSLFCCRSCRPAQCPRLQISIPELQQALDKPVDVVPEPASPRVLDLSSLVACVRPSCWSYLCTSVD